MNTSRWMLVSVVLLGLTVASAVAAQPNNRAQRAQNLAPLLASTNVVVRDRAIKELITIGQPAVPAVINALHYDATKMNAMIVLKEIGRPAVPYLMRELRSPNERMMATAVLQLGFMGYSDQNMAEIIIPDLIAMLKQEPGMTFDKSRAIATVTLAAIGPNSLPDLILLTYDENSDHRLAAVATIGAMSQVAYPALSRLDQLAVLDDDVIVRDLAKGVAKLIRSKLR